MNPTFESMNRLIYFPPWSRFLEFLGQKDNEGKAFRLSEANGGSRFTFYSYNLKNEFEALTTSAPSKIDVATPGSFRIEEELKNDVLFSESPSEYNITINQRTSKSEYIRSVRKLQEHIHRGDIYEVNYCVEFFAENVSIDPWTVFKKLDSISQAPFSFYAKIDDVHVLCSSPERFLRKSNNQLISQPIKGTRRRSSDLHEDHNLAEELRTDLKERTENIMIVDLVRNDLSRIAEKGSVKVDELCGIYSFKQVHQMISTVSCTTKESDIHEILKATFPMGSMTGAPKIRAMQLSDEYEEFSRDLYSGAAGIILPNGDFDLNVMIRSIFYDASKKYLSFAVGSAITINADPEKEYDECLLKARAMFVALDCIEQWNKIADEK